MAKALGMKAIEMYEGMIMKDFGPLISILGARTAGIDEAVRQQVKKDLGVYDLLAEKAALEERIKEINTETKAIMEKNYHYDENGKLSGICKLDVEVNKRLEAMNKELTTAKAARDGMIRRVRLSGITADIQAVFEGSAKVIEQLAEEAKNLPPLVELYPTLEIEDAE